MDGPGRPPTDTLGRSLHDLRISVTDKCNLRCTYCMPSDYYHDHYEFLPRQKLLTFEEITRIARRLAAMGVSKVRLTGGEPLLRKDLPVLVAMLSGLDGVEDIALTTNGILLPRHAVALKQAGLRRVTVSLDTLDDGTFRSMNGRAVDTAPVMEGIASAERAGLRPIKINVVVQRGVNDGTVVELAETFRNTGHVVRFIEYMDVGNCNGWSMEQVVPSKEVLERIRARFPLEPLDKDYRGEVAERYRYADGAGEIGFISSVTEPFCGACTRVRLSADGTLYTCLFAGEGVELRGPLRAGMTDDELAELLTQPWRRRTDRYSELRASLALQGAARKKIEMYRIGG